MAEQGRDPDDDRGVKPFQGYAELLGRELLVLRAVEIQVHAGRVVCGLDIVDLL